MGRSDADGCDDYAVAVSSTVILATLAEMTTGKPTAEKSLSVGWTLRRTGVADE